MFYIFGVRPLEWPLASPVTTHTQTLTHALPSTFKSTWQMLFNLKASPSTAKNESREHHLQLCMPPRRKNLLLHPGRRVCANMRLCVCERERRVSRRRQRPQSWNIYISLRQAEERWLEREGGHVTDRSKGQGGGETKRKTKTQRKQPGLFGGEETSATPWRLPRADVGSDFGRGVYWDAATSVSCVCACACVHACVKIQTEPQYRLLNYDICMQCNELFFKSSETEMNDKMHQKALTMTYLL